MRKVKAWLVSDCGGEWSDAWEEPIRAFTDERMAYECAMIREGRMKRGADYDSTWCILQEIEVVLDDARD